MLWKICGVVGYLPWSRKVPSNWFIQFCFQIQNFIVWEVTMSLVRWNGGGGSLKLRKDNNVGEFCEWNEKQTKARTRESTYHHQFAPKHTISERCPIRMYNVYSSVSIWLQDDEFDFYLAINYTNWTPASSKWYKYSLMGVDMLSKCMKLIFKKAGLPSIYTNHSWRTTCTQLLQAGVAPMLITQMTSHKHVDS